MVVVKSHLSERGVLGKNHIELIEIITAGDGVEEAPAGVIDVSLWADHSRAGVDLHGDPY